MCISCINTENSITQSKEISQKEELSSFVMEFRKQVNGQDITGEIVSSYIIKYDGSKENVIDAFECVDSKYYLSDTDYFTVSDYGTAIGFNTGYIKGYSETEFDLSWSYSAYNGGYSLGLKDDKLNGLVTYTIVIDGWK